MKLMIAAGTAFVFAGITVLLETAVGSWRSASIGAPDGGQSAPAVYLMLILIGLVFLVAGTVSRITRHHEQPDTGPRKRRAPRVVVYQHGGE
ncbi:hypothetical protein [Amorphus orientalis]|uniref:Membrane protein YhiD involved in acid resistance n=1 Tax=Amorphus orientalis TaxID=649198 RepID=A0AAE3VSE0_9HYPH|nr:hypothetical protein [Amorphus orientalis]MDQ0317266.1 putative membrane protein YhiD involved in acid resistance [Amorphus orientalis]